MKKINTIGWGLTICLLLSLSFACSKKESEIDLEESGKKGKFKIDGVMYTGKTSILTIGGVYTVSCQQDEPFKLIQITFGSKAEAEKGGNFKVRDFGIDELNEEVELGIDGLTFDPDGDYTLSVTNKKIVINNVKLIQTGTAKLKPLINDCSIEF